MRSQPAWTLAHKEEPQLVQGEKTGTANAQQQRRYSSVYLFPQHDQTVNAGNHPAKPPAIPDVLREIEQYTPSQILTVQQPATG